MEAANEAIPKSMVVDGRSINFPPNILEVNCLKNKYRKISKKTKNPIDLENLNIIKLTLRSSLEELHSKRWKDFVKNMGIGLIPSIPFWQRIALVQNCKRAQVIR